MHIRGSESTDSLKNKNDILNGCLSILDDSFTNESKEKKTIDCDAFSFIIIANDMNHETKNNIKDFLYTFGTTLSSVTIPNKAVGANKRDSIFGSTRNVGCQHLESSIIGNHLMSGETLVITSPIKIAVHYSCRGQIVSYVCKYPHQYPMIIATSNDICFDPNMASNTPPFGVIVDAILMSCYDPVLKKYIFHVGDMGTRHQMNVYEKCSIHTMFHKIKELRNTSGVSVEMSQLDIAFNLPIPRNCIVQCSYEKLSRKNKKDSCVDFMSAEHWALHGIQTKDGKVERDSYQIGTYRLKQNEWNKPSILVIPVQQECNDLNHSDYSDDSTYYDTDKNQNQLPNIVSQIYHDCDQIAIDAKSVYSVKGYSNISHYTTQKRRQIPLTFSKMNEFPTNTIVSLQRLFQLFSTISDGCMKFVKEHGICARLEVSVRPSCNSNHGISLRCDAHLIDLLSIVFIVIHELLQRQKYKLTNTITPYEPVYTKILSLINQAQSLLRFRASLRFCDVYRGDHCSTWLRALAITIMTFIGLAGETKLKYLRQWQNDDKRYNPTNQSLLMMTDIHQNYHPEYTIQPQIPSSTIKIVHKTLRDLHFSYSSISAIVTLLESETPLSHSREILRKLNLSDMWHIAQNLCINVIPFLIAKHSNNSEIITGEIDVNNKHWRHDMQDGYGYDQARISPQLVYPVYALNRFEVESNIPIKKRTQIKVYPQDPFMMVVLKLSELSLIFDIYTPVYIKYLYKFIKLCHSREIKLKGNKLKKLDPSCEDDSFKYASKCLIGNHTDLNSLQMICNGLNVTLVKYSGPIYAAILIESLCYHYLFPCQYLSNNINDVLSTILQRKSEKIMNLIHETYTSEIPLQMKSHQPYQLHFYLFFQEKHVWITNIKLTGSNFLMNDSNSLIGCEDMYVVLDNCYNTHGLPGTSMRITLYNNLKEKTSLFDNFLLMDATNNPCFCESNTLDDLQLSKGFMLLDLLDNDDTFLDNDEPFFNMCPDVILPSVCFLYKTNIYFIDLDRNMSYFHYYDKNTFKIITYIFKFNDDTTRYPSKNWKYNTFLKAGGNFKFIPEEEFLANTLIPSQPLLFVENKKLHTSLSKHPQGRVKKTKSVTDSLRNLLVSNNINHEHFRNGIEQDDMLDIKSYMIDLVSSFLDKDLSFFFNSKIIALMTEKKIISLSMLLSALQSSCNELPHELLCPIMCLKYNLWISVWEDDCKKSKSTYFYFYDHTKDKVDCQVFCGYIHLPYQSHILYIRYSKKTNICGYWEQEVLNPFSNQDLFSYSANLLFKYSYLDGPLKSKVISVFKDYFNVNIISEDIPYNRVTYHVNQIYPTIVPLLFSKDDVTNFQQKGLLVIYPSNGMGNTYFGYIIHNDVPINVLHQKISFFNSKMDVHMMPPEICFKCLSMNLPMNFNSAFILMLYMFIAGKSKNIDELKRFEYKVQSEREIVNKSKLWLTDWLSEIFHNSHSILTVPLWLEQVIGVKVTSSATPQEQVSIAERDQSLSNVELTVRNVPKRKLSTSSMHEPIEDNVGTDSNIESTKKIKKKKRKNKMVCHTCNIGGQLIVCHSGEHGIGCGKYYHISCIDRTKIPRGDWICMTCAQNISENVDIKGFEYLVQDDSCLIENSNNQGATNAIEFAN